MCPGTEVSEDRSDHTPVGTNLPYMSGCMPVMVFGVVGRVGRGWYFFRWGWGSLNRNGQILWRNQTAQCNIERENVTLWCGCGVPAAEWLESAALCTACDLILFCDGWWRGSSHIILGLLIFSFVFRIIFLNLLPPPKKEVMFLVRSVCLSVGLLANLWTYFDEIFCRGRAWLKDQVIQFWFGGDPDHASDLGVRNLDPPDCRVRRRFVLSEHI